ncbi:PAS domain-containing protein [Temperatibacter marinus]|uniref:PAS domain-containing protein n=1 Tax=Temperatibacter marinus TaxID=1456591 RepID=A0AA52EEJ0_9PROT|nr:PAS domain-containing protein [Temperatibacter marinus]WND01623.1 PAS domain-containing protein [Temperatibacter marinus]
MNIFEYKMPEKLLALWNYWQQLPKNGAYKVPLKKDFLPQEIVEILPHIVIQEVMDRDTVLLRLTGTILDQIWGENTSGSNTIDYAHPSVQEYTKTHYEGICNPPCGSYAIENRKNAMGLRKHIHMLNLPLANKAGQPVYRVACLFEESAIKETMDEYELKVYDHSKITLMRYFDLGNGIHKDLKEFGVRS